MPPATEAQWRVLAEPRPTPVAGAPRLALSGVELAATPSWASESFAVSPSLGLSELVIAGLLRRADVRLVERRRFSAAVDADRMGTPRPAGAPPAGVSEGAELTAAVVWLLLPTGQASIEVRVTDTARGAVLATRRATLPADADPVGVARLIVGTVLATLGEMNRLPAWSDPVPGSAPSAYAASGISPRAVRSFLEALGAEEAWRWESARVAYQAAAESVGFFEAGAALARTARLRVGGTLGES